MWNTVHVRHYMQLVGMCIYNQICPGVQSTIPIPVSRITARATSHVHSSYVLNLGNASTQHAPSP